MSLMVERGAFKIFVEDFQFQRLFRDHRSQESFSFRDMNEAKMRQWVVSNPDRLYMRDKHDDTIFGRGKGSWSADNVVGP